MNAPLTSVPWINETAAALKKHYLLWTIPTIALTVLAGAFALVRPHTWKATQAIVVRDEALGSDTRQGRFTSIDAMKTAQETILEISKNQSVVTAALKEVGPPAGYAHPERWPTAADMRHLQKAISVNAPQGAEFGRTEVIYLSVLGRSRAEAVALNQAVGHQLEQRLKGLRDAKAQSIIAELEKRQHLAETDLADSTRRLQGFESQVGSDLGELRNLNESGTGDSNLRIALNQIENELRQAKATHQTYLEQKELLKAAQKDAGELVATPNRLLESQPALRRLKDGLVDAQLHTSTLLGKMSPDHPLVQAARAAEQAVRRDLYAELEIALRGLEADLQVSSALVASLDKQAGEVRTRLDRLAQLRAGYSNLVADFRQRTEVLERANKELADARASRGAAHTASLITRLDAPDTGNGPVGPGGLAIVGCGVLGGLATGLGLVLLLAPPRQVRGRRWSDYLGLGRRASDRGAAPPAQGQANAGPGRRAADAGYARRAEDPRPAPAAPAAATGEARGERRTGQDRRSAVPMAASSVTPPSATSAPAATPEVTPPPAVAPLAAVQAAPKKQAEATAQSPPAAPAPAVNPTEPPRTKPAAKEGKSTSLGQALRWVSQPQQHPGA